MFGERRKPNTLIGKFQTNVINLKQNKFALLCNGASSKTANFPALTDCSSARQMARLGASSVKALRGASRKGVSSSRLFRFDVPQKEST
jgi:hypothetical protein